MPGQVARSKLLYTAVRAPPSNEQQSGRKGNEGLNEKGFAEADMAVLSIEGELLLHSTLKGTFSYISSRFPEFEPDTSP